MAYRAKGKSGHGKQRFAALPHVVIDHPDFMNLSGSAVKLLVFIARQYNGRNNGDFTVAWSYMQAHGFKSKTTLQKSKDELLKANLITQTRCGRFQKHNNQCSLYAVTWQAIDECGGKLDVNATNTPPRTFAKTP